MSDTGNAFLVGLVTIGLLLLAGPLYLVAGPLVAFGLLIVAGCVLVGRIMLRAGR